MIIIFALLQDLNLTIGSPNQPMATGLESVQDAIYQSFIVGTGASNPLGGKVNEPLAASHEVRAPVVAYIANAHGFRQIPTQVIVKDIQTAEHNISRVESISGIAETTANTIGPANTVTGQFAIDYTHLQPLNIFSAVVAGIADVRLSKQRWPNLIVIMHRSTHTPK